MVEGAEDAGGETASGGENRYRVLWEGAMLSCVSPEKQFLAVANLLKFCTRQTAHRALTVKHLAATVNTRVTK